jgi:hypothetical protein
VQVGAVMGLNSVPLVSQILMKGVTTTTPVKDTRFEVYDASVTIAISGIIKYETFTCFNETTLIIKICQ